MPALLFSAPQERYEVHIQRCLEKFDIVFPVFYSTINRVFNINLQEYNFESIRAYFSKMVEFHDLGKLTRTWQERVGSGQRLPSHATLGAAYLWKTLPSGIKEPISFAVAIHHTDKGLLGDNIEKPDVQAILDGIAKNDGNIDWHDDARQSIDSLSPKEAAEINVNSLKDMARGLRVWAKGCSFLEQHERRLQASLAHHILKLCDISAATARTEYEKKDDKDYYGGWLMVEAIRNYVDEISSRNRLSRLKNEVERWVDSLTGSYRPEKIILFGSMANGKVAEWSDVDMVVIKDTDKPFLDRVKEVLSLLQPKVGLDVLVYTPREFENLCSTRLFFREEISAKGRVIYES